MKLYLILAVICVAALTGRCPGRDRGGLEG
jgi:hypothetical protein